MPVYTEILSDDEIIGIVTDAYKRLLILGCGACTNESIAYRKCYPIFLKKDDEDIYPYATVMELKRVKHLLESKGHEVSIKYFNDIDGFFCMTNVNDDDYCLELDDSVDAILCLCCPCGIAALKRIISTIPLFGISKLKGTLAYV